LPLLAAQADALGWAGLPARHLQAAQGEPVQRFCLVAAAYSSPLREVDWYVLAQQEEARWCVPPRQELRWEAVARSSPLLSADWCVLTQQEFCSEAGLPLWRAEAVHFCQVEGLCFWVECLPSPRQSAVEFSLQWTSALLARAE